MAGKRKRNIGVGLKPAIDVMEIPYVPDQLEGRVPGALDVGNARLWCIACGNVRTHRYIEDSNGNRDYVCATCDAIYVPARPEDRRNATLANGQLGIRPPTQSEAYRERVRGIRDSIRNDARVLAGGVPHLMTWHFRGRQITYQEAWDAIYGD